MTDSEGANLVQALEDLFNTTEPDTPEEINAVLLEAGYNPDSLAAFMQTLVDQARCLLAHGGNK